MYTHTYIHIYIYLPRCLSGRKKKQKKNSTCQAGDKSLIPGVGRYPGEGNSDPLQFSCLENPMDRGS